jgi:hypothetical protein
LAQFRARTRIHENFRTTPNQHLNLKSAVHWKKLYYFECFVQNLWINRLLYILFQIICTEINTELHILFSIYDKQFLAEVIKLNVLFHRVLVLQISYYYHHYYHHYCCYCYHFISHLWWAHYFRTDSAFDNSVGFNVEALHHHHICRCWLANNISYSESLKNNPLI